MRLHLKDKPKHKKFVRILKYAGVIFGGSLVIYLLAWIGRSLIPLGWRIGTAGDWISYGGSVIGGLVTIVTVIDALQNDENDRYNDLVVRNQPYIHIYPKMDVIDGILHQLNFSDHDDPVYPIVFIVDNVTDNPAVDIKLVSEKVFEKKDNGKVLLNPEETTWTLSMYAVDPGNQRIIPSFISPRSEGNFRVQIWFEDLNYVRDISSLEIEYQIEVEYSDRLSLERYRQEFTFYFNVNSSQSGIVLFFNDSDERLILD